MTRSTTTMLGGSASARWCGINSETEEQVYLGAFEQYTNSGNGLERETLHVMDGRRRAAMADTEDPAGAPSTRFRFQLGNHLGSVALEVDEIGALTGYEYHPTPRRRGGRSAARPR